MANIWVTPFKSQDKDEYVEGIERKDETHLKISWRNEEKWVIATE